MQGPGVQLMTSISCQSGGLYTVGTAICFYLLYAGRGWGRLSVRSIYTEKKSETINLMQTQKTSSCYPTRGFGLSFVSEMSPTSCVRQSSLPSSIKKKKNNTLNIFKLYNLMGLDICIYL